MAVPVQRLSIMPTRDLSGEANTKVWLTIGLAVCQLRSHITVVGGNKKHIGIELTRLWQWPNGARGRRDIKHHKSSFSSRR